jgi:hypothetical protein
MVSCIRVNLTMIAFTLVLNSFMKQVSLINYKNVRCAFSLHPRA